MTSPSILARHPRLRAFARRVPFARRVYAALRRGHFFSRDRNSFTVLALLAVVVGAAATLSPMWFPPAALVLVVLSGGLALRVRSLAWLLGVVTVVLAYEAVVIGLGTIGPGLLVTMGVTAGLAMLLARTREQIGVQGLRGEWMLLELRDRLKAQGQLPKLPSGWGSKSVLVQAGGSSFGGDFVVSAGDKRQLEVALVDVAGKGVDAGTRALMLSGAFGGLLGSVPADGFLPACNAFLHRKQLREEGFVTAVHVTLDLISGAYVVESAGHPPAVQFDAGSGTWRVNTAKGVVLGVVPHLNYEPEYGVLRPGDALLLYTDGLVESPGSDIDAGIDRLLGKAEGLVTRGFREGAEELVSTMAAGRDDDCALVLIWRNH